MDELYERIYRREILQARLLGVISVLTMIIACLGLVGLMHYLAGSWLENFVYRIEIKWWIMLLTGAGFLVVSLFTVTCQSWKAALRNPASSLRYE